MADMAVDPSLASSATPVISQTTSSPLSLDISQRSSTLLHDLTPAITLPNTITAYAGGNTPLPPVSHLLAELATFASHEGTAPYVLRRFAPLALDIVARWIEEVPSVDVWEARLCVLASMAEPRPDLWAVISAFLRVSPFKTSPLATLDDPVNAATDRTQRLLLAAWRLLIADPALATRADWPTAPFHALRSSHPDAGVRLLAIQVLAKIRGWSEAQRAEMESTCVGANVDAPVYFGYRLNEAGQFELSVVDGWMLAVVEDRRVKAYEQDLLSADEKAQEQPSIKEEDLGRRTTVIGDHLFLRTAAPTPADPQLIHVATTAMNSAIAEIAPRLEGGMPILISAPPSAGKTHIVQHLSSRLYPSSQPTSRILTIALADTTIDVKSLIGTYVSSPTKPGTFEWMEGALAKAVRAGRWVVFEDIDKASLEMLVTISGLAKSLHAGRVGRRAILPIPGRDEVEAGDGFAMFATRTIRVDANIPATFFGHQDFSEVELGSPSDDDVLEILTAQFGRLPRTVTTALVSTWRDLRPLSKTSGQVKARDIGLRDLEKWCARVQNALPPPASLAALEQSGAGAFANTVFQDEVLLEAADIFLASLDNRAGSNEKKAKMIQVIADGLGMDIERAVSLIDNRRPGLEAERGSAIIHVGRYHLDALTGRKRTVANDDRPYALTRPSLVTLERIAASIALAEPALLVGETGTGKTTSVQHLATLVGKPLTALNLSTQTETSDLVGGFKPIDAAAAARVLHARWQKLFTETFSVGKETNSNYLKAAAKALSGRKWGRCVDLWDQSARRAVDKLTKTKEAEAPKEPGSGEQRKRRKVVNKVAKAAVLWQALLVDIADFDLHHVKMKSKLVFSFVEGPLVRALKNGEWILLDEVNLATQETLEAIATILEAPTASLVLTERGDVEPMPRHPDFRLFACMNPATDVGKKDLPQGLRARFTELYVPPPDDDREALIAIVEGYLGDSAAGDRSVVLDVVELYSTLKKMSADKDIVDGSNAPPHFSMRTLARALMFAVQTAPTFGLRRGLWEGSLMAFTMSLDAESARRAHQVLEKYILAPMKNARAVLGQVPPRPPGLGPHDVVQVGSFWLKRGPLPPVEDSRYIMTASVGAKLSDLARVILTQRYPVLIQGPTSAGKTSAVEHLARQTGHRFVRINNHEHTDIQEYLGTYITDPQTGNLVFQEGLLVTAVRQGHWIVLDELNLAPTDVLEALNRLLDDNRELVIPETQEVIKPHPNFILFATQNPPGLYAGRKVLSRAFRNRFLEVHFDDVPKDELETILCKRCDIAPTYAKKIVQVFEELRHRRQASRVFESKSSFATLRDLFRWAERKAVGYEQLANDGYMLLAERARSDEDKVVIQEVIEKIMKVRIDLDIMYRLFDGPNDGVFGRLPFKAVPPQSGMVWTKAMQRLFALVATAAAHDEPVLLVGETGCGKTSVCEVLAAAFTQKLVGINCHQNMETADLLGSQRPVRNRLERRAKVLNRLSQITPVDQAATDDDLLALCAQLLTRDDVDRSAVLSCQSEIKKFSALFEWVDGPLIHAMKDGDLLLLDEVSLADDSVLERLNSVLEPGRTLVLAEKGGTDIDEATIVANSRFHVVATMNPGGDFGKKELSPALRNRFTEIWVPALGNRDDLLQIIGQSWRHEALHPAGPLILDYLNWFGERVGDSSGLGLRDILAWVNFSNQMYNNGTLSVSAAFHHGGQMVIVDGLESMHQVAGSSTQSVAALRKECLEVLDQMASTLGDAAFAPSEASFAVTNDKVSIGGFTIPRGPLPLTDCAFRFEAPTTALNAMRVLRGCQLPKAILLEGSPGVGKTSLVAALAATAGFHLQRINLSDQTDLIDLFGSDLPVEGGAAGEFQWRDAAFLDAMQKGDWVLLDEMNLASQTVLEGLNAVLDHRGTVYIPELGRSFDRHPDFRVFAAQNPLTQGGGRKGLPKSFLNRFTKVYLQEHTPEDLLMICRGVSPAPLEIVQKMITFNEEIREATMVTRTVGREGSPWEFNLRDLFRWFGLLGKKNGLEATEHPVEHLRAVYLQRFRNADDREAVARIFERVFGVAPLKTRPAPFLTPSWLQIGHSAVRRAQAATVDLSVAHHQLPLAETILKTVEMGWLVILAGDNGRGKRDLVRAIAQAAGHPLGEFAMHPGVDTSEILGSFEQQDAFRVLDHALHATRRAIEDAADRFPAAAARIPQLQAARERCNDPRQLDAMDAFVACARTILDELHSVMDVSAAVHTLDEVARAGPKASGFAWVDGQLLDAIRGGGWFLVSDANLCSASVLDRLNSLCEVDGVLVMSEKGSASGVPEVIKPHPDFRLFMTYDPRHGELSRAMRNRGVELYVDAAPEGYAAVSEESYALAESALLRSAEEQHAATSEDLAKAPFVANLATQMSQAARTVLGRFAQVGGAADELLQVAAAFLEQPRAAAHMQGIGEALVARGLEPSLVAELPFDAALDPSVESEATPISLFRALQLALRNITARQSTDAWISEPANGKSVLSSSAMTARRGSSRRNPTVGDTVYPFLTLTRDLLPELVLDVVASGRDMERQLSAAETIFMLLHLVEEHCKADIFDYSSVQLLASWLQDEFAEFPTQSTKHALEAVHKLAQATRLTTGLGQAPLWSLFRSGQLPTQQRATLAALVGSLSGVTDPKLRLDAIHAIVAAARDGFEEGAVKELVELIGSLPRKPVLEDSTASDQPWSNAPVARVIELDLLHEAVVSKANNFATLDLLSRSTDSNPADIVELQGLLSTDAAGVNFSAVAGWLRRLWNGAEGSPGSLFAPVALSSALRFSRTSSVPMAQIAAMDDALDFTKKSTLWSAGRDGERTGKLLKIATTLLATILAAFGCTVDASAEGEVRLTGSSPAQTHDDEEAFKYLEQSFNRRLAAALVTVNGNPESLAALGRLWHGLACFVLDLFVTNVPIDPGVRRVLLGEVVSAKLDLVKDELAVVRHSEDITKGVSDSVRATTLENRVAALADEEAALGSDIDRPTNAARLGHLFNEVFSFMEEMFSDKNTESIIDDLQRSGRTALQREDAFQLASMSFVQRLTANYTDLDDLAQPVAAAVLFAKFGLRCFARECELKQATVPATVAPIVSFPAAVARATLQQLPPAKVTTPSGQSMRADLLIALAHAREAVEPEQRAAHVPGLVGGLDRLYAAWSAIRLREAQEAQEAESLYRIRKTDVEILSEEELEAKEFAELFPSFEGDEALENITEKKEETEKDPPQKPNAKFNSDKIKAFHKILISSFNNGKNSSSTLAATAKSAMDDVMAQFRPEAFSDALDSTSMAFQVSTLHRRYAEVRTSSATANFYFSPNEHEVRKGQALLERMRTRMDELVSEWPDQMVLQHIRERVLRILKLDVRSPVAQVLSALESLLIHTDDWEPYANRDNSLKGFQLDISSLIVTWRRLELASWVRLLDDQLDLYLARDEEFTLRLYGALIHGAVGADDVDKYLETALPIVNQYISSATLGQFEYRLDVLSAFQRLAKELSSLEATGADVLSRVASVLYNIVANARLYLPRVTESLQQQRKIIDGAVKDFIKLASWKDINVFALKASAQKSHKQLHRNIRKFREVLMQPIAPILMDANSICPQDPASTAALARTGLFEVSELSSAAVTAREDAGAPIPGILSKLNDTFLRYTSVHETARAATTATEASQLESMAVDIIETAAMLQKATPSVLTKENTKVVNNLTARKRKAFADMFKALRQCGFSQSVPADKLARQTSTTWLSGLPSLSAEDLPESFDRAAVTKVVDYHHRQAVLMSTLRAAFNGHNPDIASQDLGRGIGFAESLYNTALGEHGLLATQLEQLSQLSSVIRRLHHCAMSSSIAGGDKLRQTLTQTELDVCRLHEALREVEDGVREFRELQGTHVGPQDLLAVHEFRQESTLLTAALEAALSAARASGWSLFGHDEATLIDRSSALAERVVKAAETRAAASPELRHLFLPLAELARSMPVESKLVPVAKLSTAAWTDSDTLIQALLVVAQSIDTTAPPAVQEDEYALIPASFSRQAKAVTSLRISEIISRLGAFAESLATELSGHESSAAPATLRRILPFVEILAETFAQSVSAHLQSSKAIYKLNYVVARVLLDIAQKGFCKPQEESEEDSKNGDDGTVEGTGIGSGSGDKNVSNEIEDESQVEGLKGEEEEQEKEQGGDDDDDDDAVSMENDFDGALEDGKDEGEDDKDKDDDGEEDELDDHVGDVDPLDPGAVDEKFWDGEKEEEKEEESREDLMNEKTQETGESEVTAKQGEDKESKSKDKEEEQPQDNKEGEEDAAQQDNDQGGDDEMEEIDENGEEEEDDRENEGPDQGPQQDNVAAPEGENLDLPEDMDLGDDDEQDEGGNDQFDDDIQMDEGEETGEMEDNGVTSDQEGDAEEDPENAPDATGVTEEDADENQEESDNQNLDISASNDATAQEAASAGRGQGATAEKEQGEDEEMDGEEDTGVEEQEEEEDANAEGAASSAPNGGGGPDEQEASGPTDSSGAPLPNDQQEPQQDRSLGDIMKEIRRRRDEILNKTEREEVTDNQDAEQQAPGQVEYLNDADEDDGMQALGPAREEEQKLEDLNVVDEEEKAGDDDAPLPGMEDDDQDEQRVENMPPPKDSETIQRDKETTDEAQSHEKALTQADIVGNAPVNTGDAMDVDDDEGTELATEIKPDEHIDEEIDLAVVEPAGVVDESDGAEDQWRHYAALTSDLSYALCEQLRLILEPTLATRLQGDFRTGKRLNMRKIIPYIASEYTKDKIWLRRTKPSRREYQVLLSLDDSRSMAESHSVHLAYQTLALVSQALTKLEVGQVSIARFGESVDVLHEFGESFSDADGAKVMRSFKFDQHRTDVAALVERTLAYLGEARNKTAASSSSPDLWQLQIIISDGVCQDHERLRRLLRRALEERVMIVFLIVDSLAAQPGTQPGSQPGTRPGTQPNSGTSTPAAPQRTSILNMQTVNYINVNGAMQLDMQRYLDTFPFEFYVVLRDVEALPSVLSDTLRQWMARVSQSEE